MKINNTKNNLLGKEKKYLKNDTSYSSIWLFNKNKDILGLEFKDKVVLYDKKIFSEFNPSVAKNIISFWSKEGDYILDPFAGRVRGFIAQSMERYYSGFEIVDEYYDYLQSHDFINNPYPPQFINDDCINIKNYFAEMEFDLIFTCPPYWNLEKYQQTDKGLELSSCYDYNDFLHELTKRIIVCGKFLKKDKYLCVIIGDFRKNGKYYSLHSDFLKLMNEANNFELHDIIVIQNLPFHTGAFYFGGRKKYKKVSKIHEFLLIFKKK
jgi:DNA modification methylase